MCDIVADELKHVKDVLGRTQDEATLLEDALNQQVLDYKVRVYCQDTVSVVYLVDGFKDVIQRKAASREASFSHRGSFAFKRVEIITFICVLCVCLMGRSWAVSGRSRWRGKRSF